MSTEKSMTDPNTPNERIQLPRPPDAPAARAGYSDGVNDGLSIAKSLFEEQLAMKVRAPNEAEEAWANRELKAADSNTPRGGA